MTLPKTKTEITASLADMQCIFGNLFENSLYWLEKVSEQDRRIEIKVNDINGSVEVLFGDSGPGVPEKVREFLFQPYFSTKPDGGGVGLARVKQMVDEYEGTIELAVPGLLRGATFKIVLPRQAPQQEVSHVA